MIERWTRRPTRPTVRAALLVAVLGVGVAGSAAADHHEDTQLQAGPESVVRAWFTRGVVEREPIDELSHVANDVGQITFFSELRDLKGHTVIHRWEWNGKLLAEVAFEVRGPRWRVWSTKEVMPEWLGTWQVTVVDSGGGVLAERTLQVSESAGDQDTAPAVEATSD